MLNINPDILVKVAAAVVGLLLLPLVMAWGMLLSLRGIRSRLDRLISLMEPGTSQDQRPVPAASSQEERVKRALRNLRGAS